METTDKAPPQNLYFEQAKVLHLWYCRFLIGTMIYSTVLPLLLADYSKFFQVIDFLLVLKVFGLEYFYRRLQRKGEVIRRSILMDDSFGTKLYDLDAAGFYDNATTSAGVKKLLANVHQSAFYTAEISKKMLQKSFVLMIIWFAIVIIALFWGSPLSLGALKIWLSYMVVGRFLDIMHLSAESAKICRQATKIWAVRLETGEAQNFISGALSVNVLYETVLSESRILLDTKVKKQLDQQLEAGWADIRDRYELAG